MRVSSDRAGTIWPQMGVSVGGTVDGVTVGSSSLPASSAKKPTPRPISPMTATAASSPPTKTDRCRQKESGDTGCSADSVTTAGERAGSEAGCFTGGRLICDLSGGTTGCLEGGRASAGVGSASAGGSAASGRKPAERSRSSRSSGVRRSLSARRSTSTRWRGRAVSPSRQRKMVLPAHAKGTGQLRIADSQTLNIFT